MAQGPIDDGLRQAQASAMSQAMPWIAIVDDDPSVLKALARLLRAHGLHVRTYTSAQEFLAALREGLPECLIVDLQMPEMTGLELQLHLRHSGVKIPTIVITAGADTEARELCAAAGASAILLKPLQDALLLAAINSITGGQES